MLKPTAERFALSLAKGTAREIMCWGARGDGKTIGALWGMVMHAVEHQRAGFPLPTVWLGMRDTLENHALSTHKSLLNPLWEGRWRLHGGGKVAVYALDGIPMVRLELVGANAEAARTECHGLWVEEPAPALHVSGGVTEDIYGIAFSSQRLETHARVAVMTSNYPEEEHWTAQRFAGDPQPGTMYFRIPAGERASEEYRQEMAQAYANRPDLKRRLVDGKFGAVILGDQVATGFNEDLHAPIGSRLRPEPHVTVHIGQDAGLTPASVIGQRIGARLRILASLYTEHGGIKQHVRELLRPWLAEHTPWALDHREALVVHYDPSMNTDSQADSEQNTLRVMQAELQAIYRPGGVSWDARKNPMLAVLNEFSQGQPVLQVDPVQARGLVTACRGGWHYGKGPDGKIIGKEPVKNHPHSDHGDGFCYLVGGVKPLRPPRPPTTNKAKLDYHPMDYLTSGRSRVNPAKAKVDFSVW